MTAECSVVVGGLAVGDSVGQFSARLSVIVLGFDIGGTKSAVVVGTAAGEILARREWPSHAERGPDAMLEDLFTAADALRAQHPATVAIGISIGGPLDVKRGIVMSPPNLPGWDDIQLTQRVAARFGLPVRMEHDAAACAKAESLWGAGQGVGRVVYLTCGTGFGMGVVIDGKTYYGSRGQTCEIGHVRYRPHGPTAFGKTGSFEAYCAGASLGKLACWLAPETWPTPPTGEALAQSAAAGDAVAQRVLKTNAQAVGAACALIADLICPGVILLGSLARYLGDGWLAEVRESYVAEVGSDSPRNCPIKPAALGARLQDCSAIAAALG